MTRFRFRHTVSPRYQNSIGGTIVDFDDACATGRVHRPMGRLHIGEMRCPRLALDKLVKRAE